MQEQKKKNFFSKLSENTKVSIFRWWFVGAITLFIGFGTQLGMLESPMQLVFALGIVIGVGHIFIFNPIVYGMFEVERRGKIMNRKYYERTIIQGTTAKLLECFKSLALVFLVYLTYQFINMGLNNIYNKSPEHIFIPLEPVLFSTFFLFYHNLAVFLYNKILDLLEKRKNKDGDQNA